RRLLLLHSFREAAPPLHPHPGFGTRPRLRERPLPGPRRPSFLFLPLTPAPPVPGPRGVQRLPGARPPREPVRPAAPGRRSPPSGVCVSRVYSLAFVAGNRPIRVAVHSGR